MLVLLIAILFVLPTATSAYTDTVVVDNDNGELNSSQN